MNTSDDAYTIARNMAVDHLKGKKSHTEDDFRSVVEYVITYVKESAQKLPERFRPVGVVDGEQLMAELMHLFSITAEKATALDAKDPEHLPWLHNKKASMKTWPFWRRYESYLERELRWSPNVVNDLHDLTDMVLSRLEDPVRPGKWDRRGMVVGSVQSGKTANYTGLINKAVDTGYKLIIVLAGMHDNLRSQTQIRIDEGVLGFDTQKNLKRDQTSRTVGVGNIQSPERMVIHPLTSRVEKGGDFNAKQNAMVMLRGEPVILVVKKSTRKGKDGRPDSGPLGNLLTWILQVAGTDEPETGKRIVKDVPLLLIDDEADNASINTKAGKEDSDGEESVSAINGKIREILDCFEKASYVGYTATPFANIFINPEGQTDKHGEDIFPRSFIINVKAPSDYVGPAKVFGLGGDVDAGIEAHDGLPIVRRIADFSTVDMFPPKHKMDHVPVRLPDSLKRAIRVFILTSAARRARGQGKKHCSMLVHVTRFVDVQNRVAGLVKTELSGLQRRISDGDGIRTPTLLHELEELWKTEFIPVSEQLGKEAGSFVTWAQVAAELHAAAFKIAVLPINGYAKEALDYKDHEAEGRSVIAVGGNKLSRGLTLEGLAVSYFLRTTRMYDTLMQMGRWFGYRPGYLDLCRLYTTTELTDWYRHIALAEIELRREFDHMKEDDLEPANYGLRVRTHAEGMIVTALNKMTHSQTLELSWAGVLVQTRLLPRDLFRVQANAKATDAFLASLSSPVSGALKGTRRWNDVPGTKVADYIGAMQFPAESARASGKQLAAFIRKQTSQNELTNWTVGLMGVANSTFVWKAPQSGLSIGRVGRTPDTDRPVSDIFVLKKANIIDPADQSLDFQNVLFSADWATNLKDKNVLLADEAWLNSQVGKSAWEVALALSQRWLDENKIKTLGKAPNGRVARELRQKKQGLLLIYPLYAKDSPVMSEEDTSPFIGLALSFPTSETAATVEYKVNTVWGAMNDEDSDYDN